MSTATTTPHAEVRLGRLPEVRHVTAMSRTTIHLKVRDGEFPAPVHISERGIAWRMDEVAVWIDSRPRVATVNPPCLTTPKGGV